MRCWLQILLLLFLVDGMVLVNGQSRAANWIFGSGHHMVATDTGLLPQVQVSDFRAFEGSSTISDEYGNLLFYSNNIGIWDRSFDTLYNSDSLSTGTYSTSSLTQGSIFLPMPRDSNSKYYMYINIDDLEYKIYYSVIDVILNSELGGIVPTKKRLPLWSNRVSEQLTAIRHANGQDWWVVFVTSGTSTTNRSIVSVLLTDSGSAVYSECQIMDNLAYSAGQLVASDDGEYLIMASQEHHGSNHYISYYSFDRCYGDVVFLDSTNLLGRPQKFYGAGFGHKNNIMYVTAGPGVQLFRLSYDGYKLNHDRIFNGVTANRVAYRASSMAKWNDCLYYTNTVVATIPFLDSLVYYLSRVCFSDQNDYVLEPYYLYLGERNFDNSLPNFPNYDLGPLVGSPCDTLSPPDTTQVGLPITPQALDWSWSITPTVSGSSFQVSSSQPARLVVHDLYGRELLSMDCAGQCGFDLNDHTAGWYIVSLTDRSGQRSEARKVLWQP